MEYLQLTDDEKSRVRDHYEMTENSIEENVRLIKVWKEKMPHLPQDIEDGFIERQLLRNKFRIEQTKKKIENYYTIRGKNSNLFEDLHEIVPSKHAALMLPMPKLTENLERVSIIKMRNTDPEFYDLTEIVKLNLAVGELMLRHDYGIGDRFVFDLSGLTVSHLFKINPMVLQKNVIIFEEGFSCRIVGIDVINAPAFVNKIMTIIKTVIKPKIFSRIRFHANLSSLLEAVPPEHLPAEYGGTQSNIPDLLDIWDKIMASHKQFFVENCKMVSNKALRPEESRKDENFGTAGSFKKLAID